MLNKEDREYQEDMINTYGGIPDCSLENCDGCDDEHIEEVTRLPAVIAILSLPN